MNFYVDVGKLSRYCLAEIDGIADLYVLKLVNVIPRDFSQILQRVFFRIYDDEVVVEQIEFEYVF